MSLARPWRLGRMIKEINDIAAVHLQDMPDSLDEFVNMGGRRISV